MLHVTTLLHVANPKQIMFERGRVFGNPVPAFPASGSNYKRMTQVLSILDIILNCLVKLFTAMIGWFTLDLYFEFW